MGDIRHSPIESNEGKRLYECHNIWAIEPNHAIKMFPYKVKKYQQKDGRIHFKTEKEAWKHLRKIGQLHALFELREATWQSTKNDFEREEYKSDYKIPHMLNTIIGFTMIKTLDVYVRFRLRKVEEKFPEVLI